MQLLAKLTNNCESIDAITAFVNFQSWSQISLKNWPMLWPAWEENSSQIRSFQKSPPKSLTSSNCAQGVFLETLKKGSKHDGASAKYAQRIIRTQTSQFRKDLRLYWYRKYSVLTEWFDNRKKLIKMHFFSEMPSIYDFVQEILDYRDHWSTNRSIPAASYFKNKWETLIRSYTDEWKPHGDVGAREITIIM